jgi:hypothetical protein
MTCPELLQIKELSSTYMCGHAQQHAAVCGTGVNSKRRREADGEAHTRVC